MYHIATFIVR